MDPVTPHCIFECTRRAARRGRTPAHELPSQLTMLAELRREGVLSPEEFDEATVLILAGV